MFICLVFNSNNNNKNDRRKKHEHSSVKKNMSTKPFPDKDMLMDLLGENFKMTVSKMCKERK